MSNKICKINSQHGTLLVNERNCKNIIVEKSENISVILTANEQKFLQKLNYWIRRETYGAEYEGNIWIYNTLEQWATQLRISKRTTQRIITSLKQKGFIKSAYLAANKRDRTLFYTIDSNNFDITCLPKKPRKIFSLFKRKKSSSHMAKSIDSSNHMNGHMYIIDNINNNNKSLINQDNDKKEIREIPQEELLSSKHPSTSPVVTIQQMYDVMNEVLGEKLSFRLTKEISKWIGAARNRYFQTLERWRNFLETIKRNAYLMGEKFILTIQWLLRFKTIKNILSGAYGGFREKEEQETMEWSNFTEKLAKENESREIQELIAEIEQKESNDTVKNARKRLLREAGIAKYKAWLRGIKMEEEYGKIVMEAKDPFRFDYIKMRCGEVLEMLNIKLRMAK